MGTLWTVTPTQNLLLNSFVLQYKTEDLRTHFILGSPQILAGLRSYFNSHPLPYSEVEPKWKTGVGPAEALRGTKEHVTPFPRSCV